MAIINLLGLNPHQQKGALHMRAHLPLATWLLNNNYNPRTHYFSKILNVAIIVWQRACKNTLAAGSLAWFSRTPMQ